jgi:hypothetical protein
VWRAEERGKSISIYSLAPLLGPAVGPTSAYRDIPRHPRIANLNIFCVQRPPVILFIEREAAVRSLQLQFPLSGGLTPYSWRLYLRKDYMAMGVLGNADSRCWDTSDGLLLPERDIRTKTPWCHTE